MNSKLFDALVAAICNGTEDFLNLQSILLTEILDLDEEITVEDAEALANKFLEENFVEANDVAQKLNEEAMVYLYERTMAARGW